jgi:hypothetical protein
MVFNSANNIYVTGGTATDGFISAYDPLAASWFYTQNGRAPFFSPLSCVYDPAISAAPCSFSYELEMEYSPQKNVAVYGGAAASQRSIWRMDGSGNVAKLTDCPIPYGIQRGNLVVEPVTGNFLVLGSGQLWELDPSGVGTWTQQTGSRMPPAAVGVPGPAPTIDAIISSSISDYGVVAYITQKSPNSGTFYLYKHA